MTGWVIKWAPLETMLSGIVHATWATGVHLVPVLVKPYPGGNHVACKLEQCACVSTGGFLSLREFPDVMPVEHHPCLYPSCVEEVVVVALIGYPVIVVDDIFA